MKVELGLASVAANQNTPQTTVLVLPWFLDAPDYSNVLEAKQGSTNDPAVRALFGQLMS